ncbi:MAG TPA: hypothetical protein VGM19_04695 [Armatimonadota bacterium]|jgi:hypothetical protein
MNRSRVVVSGLLLALVATAAGAQGPAPLTRGTYMSAAGQALPIEWKLQNLQATETADALRLEVAPQASGSADSAPLALPPLYLHTIYLTSRRGPGVNLDVQVRWIGADQKPGARQMVWQLPDRWRLNWFPISPFKTRYAQRFCLPPGATQVTLHVALTGHPDAGQNYFDLCDLSITRGAQVPLGTRLGPNLLPGGDMETVAESGMPLGWSYWSAPPDYQVLEKDAAGRPAHGGQRFFAVMPGKNCILADGNVPVEKGRAYLLSLWARGKGDIGLGAQSLEAEGGQRVAEAQQVPFHVEADDWEQFSYVWYAESLWVDDANVFLGINPQTELDLDDISLQLISP